MNIVLQRINNENMDEIKKIYDDSFPIEEMIPYTKLVEISNDTDHLFYGIYDDCALVGMNYLILKNDILYILYLAISKEYQSKGYGKAIVNKIINKYSNYRIALNIEEVNPKYSNFNQRLKRKDFYQLFGFESQGYLFSNFQGVTFETMAINGVVSYEEIQTLFDYFKELT